ncbi:hypothetical protein T484DRAFT_1789776 [Baffinella frigidus]|nr:hypothetical protein T484DRAFT_1789776 [Cryptophyta sp. CCMP2293]
MAPMELLVGYGDLFRESGMDTAAAFEKMYVAALEIEPESNGAMHGLLILLLNSRKDEATTRVLLKRLTAAGSTSARVWLEHSAACTAPEQAAEAEVSLRRALQLDPDLAGVDRWVLSRCGEGYTLNPNP